MSVSYLHSAIPVLLLVCILSVVNAAEGGPGGPGGPGALDPDQTEFIKEQIQHLSNMTKDGLKLSEDDLHDLMSLRLNVETAEDEGRDGLSDFPGSPTIIIQANGEVRIKDKEGTLLSQDGKFDDAMFDTVFGEYRKMFEEFLAKQEGLIKQIKLLQKQVERDQKGPITETFAEMEFTFYLNGTVVVSRNLCEPECFTDRAFFDGEIDDEIFNAIFPQDVLAKLTVEEANGSSLDTKADAASEPEPGTSEPEPESESEPEPVVGAVVGSGAYKKFASSTTVFFILGMFFN
jgi:hypothetical protein